MQFVFLIWPILLLPVFVTWLTRPRSMAPLPTTAPASRHIAIKPAAAQQITAIERRRNSPTYRRAAVQAYEAMQALQMEEDDDDATSHPVQL